MTEPIEEQLEYVPDPVKEKQAKAVHFTVSMIRLLGVVLVMLGLAIVLDRLPPVPPPAGYVLIALGLAQMWVAPVWIIRKYIRARVAEEEIAKTAAGRDAP
ncbi:MAG: hypothetical protein GW808_01045 [Sphingomonadales bacterium]|nr:hypothetical protein [Sphingomonadales bacterium]PIX64105.1 MAG: hypothetical protein COZ43_12805 [Sphingomonadales bacterium CG_4_10_14_3_um_filter_58_15]NCO49080.1 hypothetical protein [Sphingomonadales bacterium]NCO99435.1 hypothetical protein [Sphingomonadales bacterium]NCP27087.1 hypothetical protein [Sphingomonadales bacterium]